MNPRRDGSRWPRPIRNLSRTSSQSHARIALEIVAPDPKWQNEVIRKGYEEIAGPSPRPTDPPSPELVQHGEDARGLCILGTPEAARVLAGLLARGHREVQECMERSPSAAAAIEEMERLLVDPDVGLSREFFSDLVRPPSSGRIPGRGRR